MLKQAKSFVRTNANALNLLQEQDRPTYKNKPTGQRIEP